jgi:ribonuclease Z
MEDAGRTDNLLEVSQDADALVIEATYIEQTRTWPRFWPHHRGPGGSVGPRCRGEAVVLHPPLAPVSEHEVLDEARAIFPNTIVVRDFDRVKVLKDKGLNRPSDDGHDGRQNLAERGRGPL